MHAHNALSLTAPGEREIVIVRAFDAPRELVFDALTQPELLKRWFHGPDGWTLTVCEVDLRVGGAYRFVWSGPQGVAMGMGGLHREIERPQRIVRTERFDQDWTGGETVGTAVLSERDGKTTLVTTVVYASREARDGALASNMEQGIAAAYDRLDAFLANATPAMG